MWLKKIQKIRMKKRDETMNQLTEEINFQQNLMDVV